MGVQGLWDLLSPVGRRVSVETLAGKRLAIDASIWMIQFMKAMRDERGEMVKNAHLLGFFRRICKLLFLRVKPLFVFDGGTPALKWRTVSARRKQRENAQTNLRKTAEKLLLNQLKTTRLKALAKELEEQRTKKQAKGKNVLLSEDGPGEKNDARVECINQEKIDEMLAASLAAEEQDLNNTGASTFFSSLDAQDGCPSTSFIPLHGQDGHDMNKTGASTFFNSLRAQDGGPSTSFQPLHAQDGGPSTSAFMDDLEDEDDEEMILPITNGNIDPTVLAALPPSMQLDLLSQMRERLMAENRQKYQKVKKAPQEFSELQIENYLKTVAFRREIDMVQKAASGKGVGGLQTARIASEGNKEFIFSSSFTGDKNALASTGLKKTADNQDGPELEHSTPTSTQASAVAPRTVSVSSGKKPPPSSGSDTREDFGSDIQTYCDERGHTRVSRLRAMGIRMTRDLQRNLDMMKEKEQDMINTYVTEKAPVNPAEKDAGSNDITWENTFQVSGDKSITTEEHDKDKPSDNIEMSLEISFEDGEKCVEDDEFFAQLVAGDPVPVSSVGGLESEVQNIESGSDVEWEDDIVGMQFDQAKSDVKDSQFQESNADLTKLQCEISEDAQTRSRGSVEEEAALQEAIKRSLKDLKGDMDASNNMKSGEKAIHLVSEASNQNNKLDEPINRLNNSYSSGTGLLPDMDEGKSSNMVCSPEIMSLPSADKSCQNVDTEINIPSENLVHSDVPGESSSSTLHSHNAEAVLADPFHLTDTKTSQNADMASPICPSNVSEAPDVSFNREKSKDPAFDPDIDRIASGEEHIHVVDRREQTIGSREIDDDIIEAAEAQVEDELQFLDEEYGNLEDQQRKLERNAASVNSEMFEECQELLQMFGLPYIVAPMEAEAQCAYMELVGLVEGVVTDDSDVFLFGARSVYKNIFDDRKYVEAYLMKDIEKELGLSREKLIRVAMLLGSDYTEGISGIGIVNAIEVVNAFPEEDGLTKFRKWIESPDPTILGTFGKKRGSRSKKKGSRTGKSVSSDFDDSERTKDEQELESIPKITQMFMDKHRKVSKNWHIPASFPSQTVISAYDSPQVDKSTDPCSWGKPDLFVLRRFCGEKFGWAGQKADEMLLPVLKEYNKKETQLRMEAFYSFNERFAKIRSKRVKQAVKGITGNESAELSVNPKVSGKTNKRKKPMKDVTPFEEQNQEKEQNSESLLEKGTGSLRGARASARGRRKAQTGGRRKRKETIDIELSDAVTSDDEQVLQSEKGAPEIVRRSKRPRKAAKYAESDDEINETTKAVCDSSEEENPKDENFNKDDSACFGEMGQSTAKDSVPDESLFDDYLFKGGGFCAEEDEPGNEMGKLQDDSAPVEGDSNYLETGGGFWFDDAEDDGGQLCSSSTPSQGGLDSVTGNPASNSSGSQQQQQEQEARDGTESGSQISKEKSPMKGLSAMPNLRRKRKNS